jgi:hypothetical protein
MDRMREFNKWVLGPWGKCAEGRHLYTLTYSRPWYKLFRKQYEIRCWECDMKIVEPDMKNGYWWAKTITICLFCAALGTVVYLGMR